MYVRNSRVCGIQANIAQSGAACECTISALASQLIPCLPKQLYFTRAAAGTADQGCEQTLFVMGVDRTQIYWTFDLAC